MTSIQLQTNFDPTRPVSQQAFHSPADSPRPLHRPGSQASLHLAPVSTGHGNFSPALLSDHANGVDAAGTGQNGPLTSFPGHFRPFTPAIMTLPMPHAPPSAPPLSYFPGVNAQSPIYDPRGGAGTGAAVGAQGMMRTMSHAHPMHSATEHTASTRYSPSPHSAGGMLNHESPPSATVNHSHSTYPMSTISQPTINVQDEGRGHINPSLFNNTATNYPMSRSTSGATSISDNGTNEMGRLLTPHYEYRDQLGGGGMNDMRKLSDPLGISRDRLYPASYAPSYQAHGGHGLGLGPHPQPTDLYFRSNNPYADHYAMSSERNDVKPIVGMLHAHGGAGDTDYERERQEQIMNNKRLLDDIGLGGQNGNVSIPRRRMPCMVPHPRADAVQQYRQRDASGAGHRARKPTLGRKRSAYNGPRECFLTA